MNPSFNTGRVDRAMGNTWRDDPAEGWERLLRRNMPSRGHRRIAKSTWYLSLIRAYSISNIGHHLPQGWRALCHGEALLTKQRDGAAGSVMICLTPGRLEIELICSIQETKRMFLFSSGLIDLVQVVQAHRTWRCRPAQSVRPRAYLWTWACILRGQRHILLLNWATCSPRYPGVPYVSQRTSLGR